MKRYYPWLVALCGAIIHIFTVFSVQSVGIMITSISDEFAVPVTDIAIISSVFGLTYGGFGVVWGMVADSLGIRKTLTFCCIATGIALVCFAVLSNSVLVGAILFGIVGFFAAGIGVALMPKMISAWFMPHWTGKGLGIVTLGGTLTGIGVGAFVPWLTMLIGWHGVYLTMGIFCSITAVLVFAVVRNSPAELGIVPFGADETYVSPRNKSKEEIAESRKETFAKLKRVLAMSITWKMGLLYVLFEACYYTNSTYMVVSMTDAGYTTIAAGLILSTHRAFQSLGYLFWPALSDKVATRKTVLISMAILSSCMFVLIFFLCRDIEHSIFGYATGFVLIAILGFSKAIIPVGQAQISELYPPGLLGTGSGTIETISAIGKSGGPIVAGIVVATTGILETNWLFCAACLLSVALVSAVWLPKTGGRYGNPLQGDGQTTDRNE